MSKTTPFLFVLSLMMSASCARSRSGEDPPAPARPRGLLATVNEVPITEVDLELRTKSQGSHEASPEQGEGRTLSAEEKKNVLQSIIRDELIAQRAVELGLDSDPGYREELDRLQAGVNEFKRQRLSDLFERHQQQGAGVTEADARRYFDANLSRLRTELHVWQILVRDDGRIERAHRELEAGTSFEEVARRQFPSLPEASSPWDLGYLKSNQIPESWRPALGNLAVGQTSGIIRGPRNRFWIIKLVAKRENQDITFETWRANIMEILRAERIEARREESGRELRRKARVVYVEKARHPR